MKVEDGIYMIKNNELYSINFPERWKANVVTVKVDKKVEFERMTNADRIRAMTDEELAEFLDRWELKDIDYSKTFCNMCKGEMYDCHKDCLMQWLKKEVEDGSSD